MRFHAIPRVDSRAAVSVVIPCYKYGQYVESAVRSAIFQQGVQTEVIVVDDASPDGSTDIVRRVARTYPNVTAVVHERNLGHIATYNDGFDRARHEYVLLLSADDLLAPGALARATAVMERYPGVGLAYGFAPSFLDVPPAPRRFLPHCTIWPGSEWVTSVCRRGQNPVSTPTAVMRRELVTQSGGYDAGLPHTADLLMWLRSAAKGDIAYLTGVDQAYYRVHGTNMHATVFAQLAADLEQRYEAFRTFVEESGGSPAGDACLADATRALLREAEKARRLLDPRVPAHVEAVAAMLAFTSRHDGDIPTRKPQAGTRTPAGVTRRLQKVMGAAEWRYWRRFGLRL